MKVHRFRNLTGQRFGKVIAIRPTDKRSDGGSVVWQCTCDCGEVAYISANRLTKGKVKSCGCLSHPPIKDYIGKRFGRLTVIEYMGKKGKMNTWKCICDCGKESNVGQTELQNGETQSCGCLQKEKARDNLKLVEGTSVAILERCRKKLNSTNSSGYTGVCHTKDGKWVAYISFKKKHYWLGRYSNKDDAIKARQRGEEMHDKFLEWYYSQYPDK